MPKVEPVWGRVVSGVDDHACPPRCLLCHFQVSSSASARPTAGTTTSTASNVPPPAPKASASAPAPSSSNLLGLPIQVCSVSSLLGQGSSSRPWSVGVGVLPLVLHGPHLV